MHEPERNPPSNIDPPPLPQAGAAPSTSAAVMPSSGEFTSLDPRVVKLWRAHSVINSAVLLALAAIPAVFLAFEFPSSRLWDSLAVAALIGLRVWLFTWYAPRAYQAWGYRIDEKVLETRHGIWFRVVKLLPLSRLQHVDLHRGPIERYFGLTSLLLHTAGTHHAVIRVPGLEAHTAERLRDHLIAIGGDDAV